MRHARRTACLEYLFAGPEQHGILGREAAKILCERYGTPLHAWSDFAVLGRLFGRQGAQEAELQGYLLFDSDFLARLVDLGREAREKASREPRTLGGLAAS